MHFAAAKDSPLLVGNLSVRQNGAKLPFHKADFLSSSRARVNFLEGYLKRYVDLIALSNLRVAVQDTPAKCHEVALTPDRYAEFYHIVEEENSLKCRGNSRLYRAFCPLKKREFLELCFFLLPFLFHFYFYFFSLSLIASFIQVG